MGVTLLERPTALGQIPQQPAPTDRDDDLVDPLVYEPNPEVVDITPTPSAERPPEDPEDKPRDPRTRSSLFECVTVKRTHQKDRKTNARRHRGRPHPTTRERGDGKKKWRIMLDHVCKIERYESDIALAEQLAAVVTPFCRRQPLAPFVECTTEQVESDPEMPVAYLDGDVITRADLEQMAVQPDERFDLEEVATCVGMRVLVLT